MNSKLKLTTTRLSYRSSDGEVAYIEDDKDTVEVIEEEAVNGALLVEDERKAFEASRSMPPKKVDDG